MHVAVIGAGALGAVYGVLLAARAGVRVTFVVRPARVASTSPLVIERVANESRDVVEAPVRTASVPADADVVLIAVGTEDLEPLRGLLSASASALVVLTPMLPADFERMREAFGARVLAAMPSVVAYTRGDGVVRYWLLPLPTRIDEPSSASADARPVRDLVRAMNESGIRSSFRARVNELNPATTVCFIPLAMALSLAGSVEALAADESLLALAARACQEGVLLSRRLGRAEPLASLAPFVARPYALQAARALANRFSPEALFYAEEHFGRKLSAQHALMAREMVELARARRLPHEALDDLARRLKQHASPGVR